jgi:apoptosis-inducing factor 3
MVFVKEKPASGAYAETRDAIEIDGSLSARDCSVMIKRGGRRLAVATISRDRENLQAEMDMEKI